MAESPHSAPGSGATAVWVYWEDVPGGARPPYLDLTLRTIRRHSAGLELRVLDRRSFGDLVPDLRPDIDEVPGIGSKTDYFRALLLRDFGGIWLDIDTVAMAPLGRVVEMLERHEAVTCGCSHGTPWMGLVASRSGSEFAVRWVAAMDRVIDERGAGNIVWGDLGAHAVLPILPHVDHVDIPPSGAFPVTWREAHRFFSKRLPVEPVLAADPVVVALWNNVMLRRLAGVTPDQILARDWLLSRLFRVALGLSTVETEDVPRAGRRFAELWWHARSAARVRLRSTTHVLRRGAAPTQRRRGMPVRAPNGDGDRA